MFCLCFFLQGSNGDMIFGTHSIGSERILIVTRGGKKTQVIMDKDRTHDWETHGRSNDIDESTPMDKVKAPNVFERAKEEIEALVETIHSKRTPDHEQHAKKDGNSLYIIESLCFRPVDQRQVRECALQEWPC